MSGPQSTLSGVVSLWVSERPSVMTRAIRLFEVGGRSRSRVYCRASPVNVPPAIHCSFLTALQGHGTVSVRAGPRSGAGSAPGSGPGPASGAGWAPRAAPTAGWAGHTHSLSSWAFLMLGLLMSTCSCIWLWLYCTTPACDCPGSNCVGTGAEVRRAPAAPHPPPAPGQTWQPLSHAGRLGSRLSSNTMPCLPRAPRTWRLSRLASGKTPASWTPPSPEHGGQGGAHLDQLVPAQPVDDLDDEVLGDLEVLQPDALGAVQHEEDVDGAALALCGGGGRAGAAAAAQHSGGGGHSPTPQGRPAQELKPPELESGTHRSKLGGRRKMRLGDMEPESHVSPPAPSHRPGSP